MLTSTPLLQPVTDTGKVLSRLISAVLIVFVSAQSLHAQLPVADNENLMLKPAPAAWWEACDSGDVNKLKQLHASGTDLDATNQEGWTALLIAINYDQKDAIDWLVEKAASLNASTWYGYTTLMSACTKNNVKIAQMAIDAGVDINARLVWDYGQQSAAHFAAANGARECFDLLVKHQADMHLTNSHKQTPMGWAIHFGQFDLYKHMFVDLGMSPVDYQGHGVPLMSMAMYHNRPDIMRPMAVMGLNTNTNYQQEDALGVALNRGYLECAKVIVFGQRWREKHPWNDAEEQVIDAIIKFDKDKVESMIKEYGQGLPLTFIPVAQRFVNARGNLDLKTAFSKAIEPLTHRIVYYSLLQKGLIESISSNKAEYVVAYINAGANVLDEHYDEAITKAITSSTSNCDPAVLQALLNQGYRFNPDNDTRPVSWFLESTIRSKNAEGVRLLIAAGAIVQRYMILDAIDSGNADIVTLLLNQNIDLVSPGFEYRGKPVEILQFTREHATFQIADLIQNAYSKQLKLQSEGK